MTDTHTIAHIPDEAAKAKRHLIQSYNWSFKSTGIDAIDDILSSIADAAESYHNTSQWKDEGHIERIQKYADVAAANLSAPCAVEVPTKAERHANTARNLIINQTSTDLERIIYSHDPDQSILNNDVWDRLDKMACEIEALAKSVDVAAVREDGFREGVKASAKVARQYGDTKPQGKWDAAYQVACETRSLSAEPAQGDQWHPIETAPNSEMLLLACADWPLVKCGREVPVKVGHKSFGSWTVFGASWTPTHWMPLPAAPTAEAGK